MQIYFLYYATIHNQCQVNYARIFFSFTSYHIFESPYLYDIASFLFITYLPTLQIGSIMFSTRSTLFILRLNIIG